MDSLHDVIQEFIEVVYNEDYFEINRMSEDLLGFLLKNQVGGDLSRLVLLLDEVKEYLTLKNRLYLKELKLRLIRESRVVVATTEEAAPSDKKFDLYGEVRIENLTPEEETQRMNSCQVSVEQLPRIPGRSYRLRTNNARGYEITEYTIGADGSMTGIVVETNCEGPTASGFNGIFAEEVEGQV